MSPRPLPWSKLWHRNIHDPGLLELTLAERGLWYSLQALAGECANAGAFVDREKPMTLAQLGRSLHLSPQDQALLEALVPRMVENNRLAWDNTTLYIMGWEEDQYIPHSYTPEGIRERKERHHQRQAAPPKKVAKSTPPETRGRGRGRGRGRTFLERSAGDPSKGADPREYTRGKYGHVIKY